MKLSIISPVYNAEKYIDRCVQSILSQKYKNYELILVDDHSTDSSLTKCQKWKNTDNRIKILKNPSKGVSSARNTGVRCADGEYIMFIDSDEFLIFMVISHHFAGIWKNTSMRQCCKVPAGNYSKENF